MDLSRRDCCLTALGAAAIPVGYWGAQSRSRRDSTDEQNFCDYHSTLVDGRTPEHLAWNGRKWRCAMGSTWNPGMEHCLRLLPDRARFEIRNTELDRGPNDEPGKRRSEMRFPKPPRLPNGVPLWSAMSFVHHHWDDPAGMAKRWGGVHGQLHIGSTFGGSPAVAFRRTRQGEFAITTRGENAPGNTHRYEGPLTFDRPHHMVYRVVLHPSDGALAVWVDGRQILDLRDTSIGTSHGECYWSIGCYYAGGISCPVIAEYGDHIYPGLADLSGLIGRKPSW